MQPKIGALVVGQSPRSEVDEEFQRLSKGSAQLLLKGALDDFSRAELDLFKPLNDDDALFTRLPNGEGISLSKKQVVLHGAEKLADLKSSDVDVVIMLCTGVFPEWQDFKGVLFPSRTLASMVKGCMPTGKICVFAPLPRQCANTKLRWEEKGYEVVSLPLLPNATREEAMSAGEAAALHNLDLIVLDCISYTKETKRIIRLTAGVPVILGISSAIRCALEMVE